MMLSLSHSVLLQDGVYDCTWSESIDTHLAFALGNGSVNVRCAACCDCYSCCCLRTRHTRSDLRSRSELKLMGAHRLRM
jgi:hypothetical protein